MVSNPTTIQRLTDAVDRIEAWNRLQTASYPLSDRAEDITGLVGIFEITRKLFATKHTALGEEYVADFLHLMEEAKVLGDYVREAEFNKDERDAIRAMLAKIHADNAKAAARKQAKAEAEQASEVPTPEA